MKQVVNQDVLKWADEYTGAPFHALLCDPPYHLTNRVPDVQVCVQCQRVLGGAGGNPDVCPRCGGMLQRQRSQGKRGFMGKEWDGGDIAFQPETWVALAKHLLPGAFGMAFASSRGWHRLVCAIEDAGLIIHPSLFLYAYGSGFPKATRIPDGRFDGHRYGLQAMKPAVEPIILFQVPYGSRPVDSITQTGAGALNIDAGRIPSGEDYEKKCASVVGLDSSRNGNCYSEWNGERYDSYSSLGRWPSNFLLLDQDAASVIDRQSGHSVSRARGGEKGSRLGGFADIGAGKGGERPNGDTYDDGGGASRFFFRVQEQLDLADPVYYCPKATRKERDAGLSHLPLKQFNRVNAGGLENEPRWSPTAVQNHHPTVKPLALCLYLASLLLPPGDYAPRRLLVPFAGSGSEMIGAVQAGWEQVVGVESDPEFVELAIARLAYWDGRELSASVPPVRVPVKRSSQMSLFTLE